MKTKAASAILILSIVSCGSSLKLEETGSTEWAGETTAQTLYYTLSDNSLTFVKLTLNGTEYTLPQAVSADGTRYTSDMDIVWWEKGDSAFVQTRDSSGNWETTQRFNTVN